MQTEKSKQPRGNVLFLILIAVALFAALSYAVTKSSQSGKDEAPKETVSAVVNTAALTQYPSTIRTAVLGLIVNGVDPVDMLFNKPEQFTGEGYTAYDAAKAKGVFNEAGGKAVYQQVPGNMTVSGQPIDWAFTLDFEVPLVGLSSPSSLAGNDLIAFASGVSQTACARVNQELYNDATIPVAGTPVVIGNNRLATATLPVAPAAETVLTSSTPSARWFEGKSDGCFQNGVAAGSPFVYYYVLAER
jgi:hypothetical protein